MVGENQRRVNVEWASELQTEPAIFAVRRLWRDVRTLSWTPYRFWVRSKVILRATVRHVQDNKGGTTVHSSLSRADGPFLRSFRDMILKNERSFSP